MSKRSDCIFRMLLGVEGFCMNMEYRFTHYSIPNPTFIKRLWVVLWRIPGFVVDEILYLFYRA